jgi:penicillin-binding protein 1B
MAAAYTVFSNNGVRLTPSMVKSVRTAAGDPVVNFSPETRQVLDPRVAYVMTDMMEGVINNGLGFTPVRGRGFQQPAAGKTGTSHDGWFAGYTSNLLCIVWVGFDDYSEIHLTGAQTAAPIWTEFMKKASALPRYSNMTNFSQPSGVVDVQLDKVTNLLATPSCPQTYTAAFIVGTEPTNTCDQGTGVKGVLSRIFGLGNQQAEPPQNDPDGQKKKGFMQKFTGIFKSDKPSNYVPKPPDASGPSH